MKKFLALALVLVLGLSLALTGCSSKPAPAGNGGGEEEPEKTTSITFYSGPMGGAWFPLSGAIASILHTELGLSVDVVPGGGMLNIAAVEQGDAQLGWLNSVSGGDAWNGVAPFEGEHRKQAAILVSYSQYWQPVSVASVKSIEEWEGHVVAPSPRGHTGEQMTERVLDAYGLSYDDLAGVEFVSYADAVSAMRDGHIHALGFGSTAPTPPVTEIAMARDINYLNVDEDIIDFMVKEYPGVVRKVIPAGTYPDQDEDWITIGWESVLFTTIDLEEDLVYDITRIMFEKKDDLATVTPDIKDMSLETWAGTGVPLHPGAARYYEEQGIDIPDEWIHPGA